MRNRPTRRNDFDDDFDFAFRPATYWEEIPGDLTLLTKIRGAARRRVAERALAGEQLPRLGDEERYREAMEFVLAEALTSDERTRWGAIHPMMLGGEFLPTLQAGEIEIVRIELQSTTFDVIELRAQLRNGRIHYRVVDEYQDEGSYFTITPKTSAQPLTFGALIALLDSTVPDKAHSYPGQDWLNIGQFERYLNGNLDAGGSAFDLIGFVSVSSPFYPQLADYYVHRANAWYLEAEGGDFLGYLESELEDLCSEVESESIALRPLHEYEPGDEADLAAAKLLVEGRLEEAETLANYLDSDGIWIHAHIALRNGDRVLAAHLARTARRY
jgi:hypothetical protein